MPIDVDRTAVIGRWVRHGPEGAPAWPPLRVPLPDGRWNRGDVVGALYLADSEETVWAEWYRHLAEKGLPPNEQMPRRLWQWDVNVRSLRAQRGREVACSACSATAAKGSLARGR